MAITAVRVKGLMFEFWTGNPADVRPRYRRFADLIRDSITESGIRICTDQRTNQPCVFSLDELLEMHELPGETGHPSTAQYFTSEVLVYLDDADDPDRLTEVMDNLPLGAEFPYSAWRPAEMLTSSTSA